MFLTLKKLEKVSTTAKIDVKAVEREFLFKTVNEEFSNLDIITKVNTDNYKPMTNPNELEQLEQHTDEVKDGDNVDALMASAPNSLYNYFAVPKVIKKGGE